MKWNDYEMITYEVKFTVWEKIILIIWNDYVWEVIS